MGNNLATRTMTQEDIDAICQRLSRMVQREGSPLAESAHSDVRRTIDAIKGGDGISIECLDNIRDSEGNSLFHVLVLDQDVRLIRLLLEAGCHARTANHKMKSPLHTACEKGHLRIVKLLLKYGGYDICMASDESGNYPLHSAVMNTDKEIFRAVLEYCRREVNELNKEEKAPLHLIAQSGNIELAKVLFSDGAKNFVDINAAGSKGVTPLHLAAQYGHAKVCDLLLSLGADPNATTWLGQTPLHVSCMISEECADSILSADSLWKVPAKEAKSKLFSAHWFRERRNKSSPNIEELANSELTSGGNQRKYVVVESRDVNGNFPLHYACMVGREVCESMVGRHEYESLVHGRSPMSVCLIEKVLKLGMLHAKCSKRRPLNMAAIPNLLGNSCLDIVRRVEGGNEELCELFGRYHPAHLDIRQPLVEEGTACMEIQLASDLHIECLEFNQKFKGLAHTLIKKSNCDYLALLGDIGLVSSPHYEELLYELADRYKKVFFLLGNHEYYESVVQEVEEKILRMCEGKKSLCYLTSDRSYLVDGFRIIGCTLWSEVRPEDTRSISECMCDYRHIKIYTEEGERNLRVEDTVSWHRNQVQFLRREIQLAKTRGEPVIVMTHHSPIVRFGCSNPSYWRSEAVSAFCTDLLDMFDTNVVAWMYGHTHWFHDMVINGTRVVSNQCGYIFPDLDTWSQSYNPGFVVSIPRR